jgi:RsiW-degrading membrane proteinase PrsW (M82 family)
VLGLASAAGFAVLESMGYGYNALTTAGGELDHAALVPVQRGMLAPFGHMAWTGTATIVLWTEWQRRDRVTINARVLVTLATVMALHSLNDYATFEAPDTPAFAAAVPIIAISSYLFFKFHARELTPPARNGNVPPGWRSRSGREATTTV